MAQGETNDGRAHGVLTTYRAGCRCEECRAAYGTYAKARRKAREAALVNGECREIEHGRISTYSNYNCRCEPCKAAWAEQLKRSREDRRGKVPRAHGLSGYKNWGCRCDVCGEAGRVDLRARYPERVDQLAAYTAHAQASTLEQARNHGHEWTGAELEMAAREDLTAGQVAAMLGRTLFAVRNKRARIREGDPKTMRVLGPQP